MSTSEGEPEFKWGDSHNCEAVITHTQVQKGQDRYVVPFGESGRVDLGADVEERPEIIETTIECGSKFCHLEQAFRNEGMGFSAFNQSNERSEGWVRENCGKWKALVRQRLESGRMPKQTVPRAHRIYLP